MSLLVVMSFHGLQEPIVSLDEFNWTDKAITFSEDSAPINLYTKSQQSTEILTCRFLLALESCNGVRF